MDEQRDDQADPVTSEFPAAALLAMGVRPATINVPITGSKYLSLMGGPSDSSYWTSSSTDVLVRQRDEFFLAVTSVFAPMHLMSKIPPREPWRLKFDVAYLFQIKPLAQSAMAIELLTNAHCYADAFAVIRALHSRIQQTVLFSLGPYLFDQWLKTPRDEKFLDGHMRTELGNHDLHVYPHLYDQFSEVVHGQFQALSETGYLEQGLFPAIPPVANMVYVAAKFLFGVAGWLGVSALVQDADPKDTPEDLTILNQHYLGLIENQFQPSRMDHLWTMIAEERHWEKTGKNKAAIARWFEFNEYRRQLNLFHRKAQPKLLGKKYRP